MIIRNGNIHVGNGTVLNNYDILVEDRFIKSIAKNIKIEDELEINAEGKEVYPGFIDPVSSFGCMDLSFSIRDNNETSDPVTPNANIKYSFNHREIMLEELYKVGITTIGASPGNSNIIGGQMAAFKTYGLNSNTMLIKEAVGVKGSVINSVKEIYGERKVLPMTKMGIFARLEDFLNKRLYYKENKILIDSLLSGAIPLFITANKAWEIDALIHLTEKFENLKLVIVGAYQIDRCIENVSGKNISIIVGEQIYLTAKNYNETDLLVICEQMKKGNLVSFTLTGDYSPSGKVKYLWNAIEFLKAGVESEDVIKMMTLNPAKILGIDNILGSIEEGKIADIVIYTKNPIEYYDAKVTNTIVEGKVVYSEEGINC